MRFRTNECKCNFLTFNKNFPCSAFFSRCDRNHSPAAGASAEQAAAASQPQSYADLTKYIAYAPPRKDAIPLIDKSRLADLPTAPNNFKRALQIDATFWADNADAINKRFQVWLTQ